jgi:hypothetical protein
LENATFIGAVFSATFGGNEVLNLVATSDSSPYALQDFTVTATASTTDIARSADLNNGDWELDDVSVTDDGPSASTPEPASLLLLGSGLFGLRMIRRRKG